MGEFHLVVSKRTSNIVHGDVQEDAVEMEFGLAGFSVDPVNGHKVDESPLKCQKVWFIVCTSGFQ